MRRRSFITLLGGAAAAWPLVAMAQPDGRVRRVGILQSTSEDDPGTQAQLVAWRQELAKLGWVEGRNLRVDLRHTAGDPDRMRSSAAQLLSAGPDVMVVGGQAGTRVLQQQTRTIPIVFVQVGDPVENGLVASLARPEGNTTGIPICMRRSPANGWNCSGRPRPASPVSRSSSTPTPRPKAT